MRVSIFKIDRVRSFLQSCDLDLQRVKVIFQGHIELAKVHRHMQYEVPAANSFGDISRQICSQCYPYGIFSTYFRRS